MRLWSFLVIPFLVTLTYGAPISEVAPPSVPLVPAKVSAAEPEVAASAPVAAIEEKVDEKVEIPSIPLASADVPEPEVIAAESAPAPAVIAQSVPEVEATTVAEEAVAVTTLAPETENGISIAEALQDETNREGRDVDDDDEEEEADDDDDDDDDEDEEDEEEDEEDSPARGENSKPIAKPKSGHSSKKAVAAGSGKPVPSLNEGGGEDDEAEDMGHFEGSGSPKSRENASDEAESDENEEPVEDKEKVNDEEEADEDDDESDEDEEADEGAGPQGLVAESSSTEVQGAEPENEDADAPPSPIVQNEIEQQPLAVAVVQNEVDDVPVVPVIVSENPEAPPPAIEQEEEGSSKPSTNKKNKDDKEDDDDEDDDDDDEDEDEEEDDNAARSEKVSQARAAYDDNRDADVLYYYPYPDHAQVNEF